MNENPYEPPGPSEPPDRPLSPGDDRAPRWLIWPAVAVLVAIILYLLG
jgi:hypothetical protein